MAWEYSDNEYIKLFRKLINWEWYSDINTTRLFIHCLLKANWKDGEWKGIRYKKGQFITSLESLSKETGLSVKAVRTALNHLIGTGEVASKKLPKGRMITVNNWCNYQVKGKVIGKEGASKGQDRGKQRAIDIRSKEHIRSKEDNMPTAIADDDDDEGMTAAEAYIEWQRQQGVSEDEIKPLRI